VLVEDDDFFELGGNSVRAAELIERIEARLSVRVPLGALLCEGCLSGS
jgi:acyl carrier protein